MGMIDRKNVIDELNTDVLPFLQHHCDMQCCREKRWISKMIITVDNAIAMLKKQKEKKGQWIPIESPTGVEEFGVKEMTVMNVRCSVCGSEEDVSFTGYKYCPRCGAKMEGRRSGNEINRRAGHARQ